MKNQSNSQFWGTGADLSAIRENLDPVAAKQFIETLGKRLFGNIFDYSKVEFRGLNLPIILIVNENCEEISVTPFNHFMSRDGRGN